MNLRILKKLSKKAAPLLAHFGIGPDALFLAEKGDCSIGGTVIRARKHWYRSRARDADVSVRGYEILKPTADGKRWIWMRPPYCPLKGTPMVGGMSGGEEPEWDERTALDELRECIRWSDKPRTMTDAEWALAQRITRTKPITQAEIDEMLDDLDDLDDPDGATKGQLALAEG